MLPEYKIKQNFAMQKKGIKNYNFFRINLISVSGKQSVSNSDYYDMRIIY